MARHDRDVYSLSRALASLTVGPKKPLKPIATDLIGFSQATVSGYFSDGRSLRDLTRALIAKTTTPEHIEAIRVVLHRGKYVTLDNRRLRAFKDAFIAVIGVVECSLEDPEIKREFILKHTAKSSESSGVFRGLAYAGIAVERAPIEEGIYAFTKVVLSWTPEQVVEEALVIRSRAVHPSLPMRPADLSSYYASFKPFILEEARSILAAGMATTKAGDEAELLEFKPARSYENPCTLVFRRVLSRDSQPLKSGDAYLLKARVLGGEIALLALATNVKNDQVASGINSFKMIVSEEDEKRAATAFESGANWQLLCLGSLISTMRMFDVCHVAPDLPALKYSLVEASSYGGSVTYLGSPSLGYSGLGRKVSEAERSLLEKLNPSQHVAIENFLKLDAGIELIQGPPGTGKTSTIVSLLRLLVGRKERSLVCAPSNKAVQVLVDRFVRAFPDVPVAFVGVDDRVPEDDVILNSVFVHKYGQLQIAAIDDFIKMINQYGVKIAQIDLSKEEAKVAIRELMQLTLVVLQGLLPKLEEWIKRNGRYNFTFLSETYLEGIRISFKCYINEANSIFEGYKAGRIALGDCAQQFLWSLSQSNTIFTKLSTTIASYASDESPAGLEAQMLNNATLVFSTLSVAGRKNCKAMKAVTNVIIDEAGQAVEAETLIALAGNPTRALLIGDIQQLPATVISPIAEDKGFGRSLMERLIKGFERKAALLNIQYRMHPAISAWPSMKYYESKLRDHESVTNATRGLAQLHRASEHLAPYAFHHVDSCEETFGNSYQNPIEVRHIQIIIEELAAKGIDPQRQIGVITFYSAQVALIKYQLRARFPSLRVSSVDGYQGDEADIIIISFVRANPRGAIGFVRDFRRLNVALTRARHALIMIGNAPSLEKQSHDVASLIADARRRRVLHESRVASTEVTSIIAEARSLTVGMPERDKRSTASCIPPPPIPRSMPTIPSSPMVSATVSRFAASATASPATAQDRRYKTALCDFHAKGGCKKGATCTYAHGDHELRTGGGGARSAIAPMFTLRADVPVSAAVARPVAHAAAGGAGASSGYRAGAGGAGASSGYRAGSDSAAVRSAHTATFFRLINGTGERGGAVGGARARDSVTHRYYHPDRDEVGDEFGYGGEW